MDGSGTLANHEDKLQTELGDRTPDRSQVVSTAKVDETVHVNINKLKELYSPTTDAAFALTMVSQAKWMTTNSLSDGFPAMIFSPSRQRAATISGDGVDRSWISIMKDDEVDVARSLFELSKSTERCSPISMPSNTLIGKGDAAEADIFVALSSPGKQQCLHGLPRSLSERDLMNSLQAMRYLNAPWSFQDTEESLLEDNTLDTTSEYYYDDISTAGSMMLFNAWDHSNGETNVAANQNYSKSNSHIKAITKRTNSTNDQSNSYHRKKRRSASTVERENAENADMMMETGIGHLISVSSALHNKGGAVGFPSNHIQRQTLLHNPASSSRASSSTASSVIGGSGGGGGSSRHRPRSYSLPFVSREMTAQFGDDRALGTGVMTGNGASNAALTASMERVAAKHAYHNHHSHHQQQQQHHRHQQHGDGEHHRGRSNDNGNFSEGSANAGIENTSGDEDDDNVAADKSDSDTEENVGVRSAAERRASRRSTATSGGGDSMAVGEEHVATTGGAKSAMHLLAAGCSGYKQKDDPLSIALRKYHGWDSRTAGSNNGYIGIYAPEDRKIRILRFIEKRKRRLWTKKVKYDVRKNFADTRVRVKGRFVKKDEMSGGGSVGGDDDVEEEEDHRPTTNDTTTTTTLTTTTTTSRDNDTYMQRAKGNAGGVEDTSVIKQSFTDHAGAIAGVLDPVDESAALVETTR